MTAIFASGSFTVGLIALIAGSLQLCDLAEEDVGEQRTGELDVACSDAVEIDHDGDAADHDRKLAEPELCELGGIQRHVGGAEVDRAVAHAQGACE